MYLSLTDRPERTAVPGARRPRVPRVVWLLGLVSLVTDVSSEAVTAILPLYLTAVLGLSTIAYGVVDGLYQGVSALVRIAGGWAADRSDHPKWVAFVGYGLSCVARVGLLFATGVGAVTAVVTADRIGKGVRTAPRDAMIAASVPTDHLGRAFGVHRTLDTIGAVIGPLLAFAILWAIPDGYVTVMVASLAFAVIGVAMIGLLVPDQRPRREAVAGPAPAPSFSWSQVADPRLVRLLVVVGVLGILTVGDGFLYLALLDRSGFAAQWFPMLYVGTNIAFLALAVPMGRLADRFGRARVLVLGHVALVGAYACGASPGSGWIATIGALLLLGVFYASTDGVIAAVAGRLVPAGVRASGIATAQTVVALARLASSLAFGVLWFAVGPQQALVLVGVLLAVAIPVALSQVVALDRSAEVA
ncbi:MFS transporter [Nocardioides currus]|uniref:MFS transporter n=1 Tax=Nocardioides currus TaxID=2133958 RepID=A0A2R7Z132_9ACTN|nr:MFS transporter [Nocardioides currus]PUA82337.1 MFS transporter [Nocardioides currus]